MPRRLRIKQADLDTVALGLGRIQHGLDEARKSRIQVVASRTPTKQGEAASPATP